MVTDEMVEAACQTYKQTIFGKDHPSVVVMARRMTNAMRAALEAAERVRRPHAGIETMARILEAWLENTRNERAKDGLGVSADTRLMDPDFWPAYGQVQNWIRMLREINQSPPESDND